MSFGPSQETPPNGGVKFDAETATWYCPVPTLSKMNEPSSFDVAELTDLPDKSFSCIFTFGKPSSPVSSLPGVPPPGLKSRQTTPPTCDELTVGAAACFAAFGTASGVIPVSGTSAAPPGPTDFWRTKPFLSEPVSEG